MYGNLRNRAKSNNASLPSQTLETEMILETIPDDDQASKEIKWAS